MKSAENKTTAARSAQTQEQTQQPFFQKDGQGDFFSEKKRGGQPFFGPLTVQPKLTIGKPGDKYEQEADSVADKVVQRLAQSPATDAEPSTVYRLPSTVGQVQRKAIFESNEDQPAADVQTKRSGAPPVQAKCAACEQEEQLQKKEVPGTEEEPEVQAKCAACSEEEPDVQAQSGTAPPEATPDLQTRLNGSRGGGQSLPAATRDSMESALGADFSGVRVHTGSDAVQMSQELGAQAFTHGNDIYFNSGKYDTGSTGGQKLLAHELVHTVQQGGSTYSPFVQSKKGNLNLEKVEKAMNSLRLSNIELIRQKNFWIYHNYDKFFAATQSVPNSSIIDTFKDSAKGESLENLFALYWKDALQEKVKNSIAKIAAKRSLQITIKSTSKGLVIYLAAAGSAVGPEGTIAGAVVGLILDIFISFAVEMFGDDDTIISRLEGAINQADLSTQLHEGIFEIESKEIQEVENEFNNIKSDLLKQNQSDLDAIAETCSEQAKTINTFLSKFDKSNNALYRLLLKTWILENAGEEDNPAKGIEDEHWETAIKELRKQDPNFSEDDDQITNHPELFAYQFRAELKRWGLKTKEADKLISKLESVSLVNISETVMNAYNKNEYTFHFKDINSYEKFLENIKTFSHPILFENQINTIKEGNFMFYISIYLDTADGSVYIDNFSYRLKLFYDRTWYEYIYQGTEFKWVGSPD